MDRSREGPERGEAYMPNASPDTTISNRQPTTGESASRQVRLAQVCTLLSSDQTGEPPSAFFS
jgi:hypothetical protein